MKGLITAALIGLGLWAWSKKPAEAVALPPGVAPPLTPAPAILVYTCPYPEEHEEAPPTFTDPEELIVHIETLHPGLPIVIPEPEWGTAPPPPPPPTVAPTPPLTPTFPAPSVLQKGVHIIGGKVEKSTEEGYVHGWFAWYHHGKGYQQFQSGSAGVIASGFFCKTYLQVDRGEQAGDVGIVGTSARDWTNCPRDGEIRYEYAYLNIKKALWQAAIRDYTWERLTFRAGVSISTIDSRVDSAFFEIPDKLLFDVPHDSDPYYQR